MRTKQPLQQTDFRNEKHVFKNHQILKEKSNSIKTILCIKEITLAFNVSCALCFYGYHLNGFISTIATTEKKTMDDQTLLSFQCECD